MEAVFSGHFLPISAVTWSAKIWGTGESTLVAALREDTTEHVPVLAAGIGGREVATDDSCSSIAYAPLILYISLPPWFYVSLVFFALGSTQTLSLQDVVSRITFFRKPLTAFCPTTPSTRNAMATVYPNNQNICPPRQPGHNSCCVLAWNEDTSTATPRTPPRSPPPQDAHDARPP